MISSLFVCFIFSLRLTNVFGGFTTLESFIDKISGEVILKDLNDTYYDRQRQASNFPYRSYDAYPTMIVLAETTNDIKNTLEYAYDNSQTFRVRSGVHSVAGYSSCSDCIIIDVSNFKKLEFIEESYENADGIVKIGAGNRVNELAYFLEFEASDCGKKYWVPHGLQNVGVGGHIHGGGWGYGVRKYGLTMDNVIEAKVITVKSDGKFKLVKASLTKNEDLFYCIRGTLGPTCGIVIEWKVKVYLQPQTFSYSFLTSTAIFTNPGNAFGTFQRQFDELTIVNSSLSDQRFRDILVSHQTNPVPTSTASICFYDTSTGNINDIQNETEQYMQYLSDTVTNDLGGSVLLSTTYYGSYMFVRCMLEIRDSILCLNESILSNITTDKQNIDQRGFYFSDIEEYNEFLSNPYGYAFWLNQIFNECPSVADRGCRWYTSTWGGKMGDVDSSITPFGNRNAKFDINFLTSWINKNETNIMESYIDNFFFTMYHNNGTTNSGYVNYVVDGFEESEYLQWYYGNNVNTLINSKCEWDPTGFFNTNPQPIPIDTC